MPSLPSKRAFFATFATGVWTQALTLVTGALTARLLGPEGRGQFAGAYVWPGILGMMALLGLNNALSIRAARDRENKGRYERQALRLGALLSAGGVLVGWFAMPVLVPANNPELLWLSRVGLLNLPSFVITSNLMAIDQGVGDFRTFNVARNILTPVYLLLLITLWVTGIREVICFLGALLAANIAVLIYRLALICKSSESPKVEPANAMGLLRTGLRFWITGIAAVLRDNADRLLLMFLLGPAALGWYVVAFTASGAHLNVSRSLNLIVFSRSAALQAEHALADTARFFRLMGLMNVALGICMVVAMPILIRLIYGGEFVPAVVPAMLLVFAQFFLSQGAILDEGLRARANPLTGMGAMIAGMCVFAATGYLWARSFNLLGVAAASIAGQLTYCTWMVIAFRRFSGGHPLLPGSADRADLARIVRESKKSVLNRLAPRLVA